jgi:hypothetical protein
VRTHGCKSSRLHSGFQQRQAASIVSSLEKCAHVTIRDDVCLIDLLSLMHDAQAGEVRAADLVGAVSHIGGFDIRCVSAHGVS